MKQLSIILFFFLSVNVFAQTKGTVKGTLTDKEMNNEPLSFANVQIKGTTIGVVTELDGTFELKLDPGSYTIVFSFLGYKTIEVPFTLKPNEVKIINKLMTAEEGVALDEVKIQTTVGKEKLSALIIDQKKAINIKTAIGAQELSKKGISDATNAVANTAGVSKGSKNILVRGLGDRFNSTSLNGIPLPSEDPEYKNISLDFFDTSIIQNVEVNKVFTSDILADVSGANVNITSKDLLSKKIFTLGFSTGMNSQTVSQTFLTIDGTNRFGTQQLGIPVSNLNQYTFTNSFKPKTQSSQFNGGLNFSYGKKFDVGESNSLSVFLVGNYDGGYNYFDGNIKQTNSTGDIFLDQDFERYDYEVSQLLMGNVKYKFGEGNSIQYNSLFIHNNTQQLGDYFGFVNPEQTGDLEFQRRQQVNNNELYVNQLIGNFKITERIDIEAKGAINYVESFEPDRRTNKYLFRDNFFSPQTNSAGENERYFSKLQEIDYNALGKLSYKLSKEVDNSSVLEIGGNFRYTERIFSATIFNHGFQTRLPIEIDNPDVVFNQASLDNNIFRLETGRGTANNPNAFDPFTYRGKRLIMAGYGNLVYQFSSNFFATAGLRVESAQQRVTYNTNIANSDSNGPSKINEYYFLPSASIKYNFNENSIFRLAASQTYTLPQFKETAPFKYFDVAFNSQGNPDLIASDIYNFDAKYEYYFSNSELISVTGFYKLIQNPIARTEIPSAGNTLTYLNVGDDATVFGFELEARKVLSKSNEAIENGYSLDAGLNLSILQSQINLDQSSIAQFTNTTSDLEGATPFLMNADLSYSKKYNNSEWQSTIVFNYFSDRVYSVGTRGFENVIEKGFPTLDFVSTYKIGNKYNISFKAQNILNPDIQLSRDGALNGTNVVLRNFKRGVNLSLGFTMNL